MKVLRLDVRTLVYEQNGHKVEFVREPDRERKKQDEKLIRGRWKVVTDEYRDDMKWVAAEIPPDFEFVVTADGVTVTRQKTGVNFALTLQPAVKEVSLVRAQGGIDKLVRGIYRLNNDSLTICVTDGPLLPADDTSKAASYFRHWRDYRPRPRAGGAGSPDGTGMVTGLAGRHGGPVPIRPARMRSALLWPAPRARPVRR